VTVLDQSAMRLALDHVFTYTAAGVNLVRRKDEQSALRWRVKNALQLIAEKCQYTSEH
jgi:hypothetical protein